MKSKIISLLLLLVLTVFSASVGALAMDGGAGSYIPGDVNGDGGVNGKDITLIRRYNAEWDVTLNLLAADVNADGVINGKDITLIRRYNAEWPDVVLLPGLEPDTEAPTEPETEPHVHTEVIDAAVPATCTATGKTEGKHCSACGEVLVAQTTVPAKGHAPGAWTVTVEATVISTGTKVRHCTVCGVQIGSETIPKITAGTDLRTDMKVTGDGYDVYQVPSDLSGGYRYGATYLYNDDGSVDAYFAGNGSAAEWDVIYYRHSPDGGTTWGKTQVVLTPTRGSMDQNSVCDPGVVYFNGYYYMAYTSTLNSLGYCNNIFVARSKNANGPFEKWNGSGWGGTDPQPIVYYGENYNDWGIGEPSLVVHNNKLYFYYSHYGPTRNPYVMAMTASATSDNWPQTLVPRGVACSRAEIDSMDIKYVDELQRFVGIAAGARMSSGSWIAVYESFDGLTFTQVDAVRENTYSCLHNVGLSGRRDGHINLTADSGKIRVVYGYGTSWGAWNTRVQPISISLSASNDMAAEKAKSAKSGVITRGPAAGSATSQSVAMVRALDDLYCYPLSQGSFTVNFDFYTEYYNAYAVPDPSALTLSGYNTNIVRFNGTTATIVGVGTTPVTVTYNGISTIFYVQITDGPVNTGSAEEVVSFMPVFSNYIIYYGERAIFKPQIRANVRWGNGAFAQLYLQTTDSLLIFSGYDNNIILVDEYGIITAKSVGTTQVTITYRQSATVSYSCTTTVTVSNDPSHSYYKLGDKGAVDYSELDFTTTDGIGVIVGSNSTDADYHARHATGVRLRVRSGNSDPGMTDPYVFIDYRQSENVIHTADYAYIDVTYKIDSYSQATPRMQLFVCAGNVTAPTAACVLTTPALINDGQFHTFRFTLAGQSWWTGDLNAIRLDYFTSALNGDTMEISSIKLSK